METVSLIRKDPILFGDDDRFLGLGKLKLRGDYYIVFMDLETGQIHIEETFTSHAVGSYLVGLDEIKDDTAWKACVYAAMKLGLTSQQHITECIQKANVKQDRPIVKAILEGKQPNTTQAK